MEILERALSSPTTLAIFLVSGLLLFILMVRELVLWFFRISTLDRRLSEIQKSLARVEARLGEMPLTGIGTNSELPLPPVQQLEKKPVSSNFPLQH
jgi:hypothetical protein